MFHRIPLTVSALLLALAAISGCSSPRYVPAAYAPAAEANPIQQGSQVAAIARSMLGVRYRYGGRHPKTGFDCSGLVYYSHLKAGRTLPRTSQGQFEASRPVSRSQLKKGDLVFFRIDHNKVSHVGIYIGDNRFIHAPSRGKTVTVDTISNPYWEKRFIRGGRIV